MRAVTSPLTSTILVECDVAHIVELVFNVPVTASVFEQTLRSAAIFELYAGHSDDCFLGDKLAF